MAKPVDNAASMAAYLFWIIESGRGSQLEGHVVKLGSYLKDTGRDDAVAGRFLMKDPQVARALKRVKELNPGEPLPMTSGTRSLAGEILLSIPVEASTKFIGLRETAMFSLECVGGARIGEIAGARRVCEPPDDLKLGRRTRRAKRRAALVAAPGGRERGRALRGA